MVRNLGFVALSVAAVLALPARAQPPGDDAYDAAPSQPASAPATAPAPTPAPAQEPEKPPVPAAPAAAAPGATVPPAVRAPASAGVDKPPAAAPADTPRDQPTKKEEPEEPDFDDRTMKGHTFVYPTVIEPAFVTTHFGFLIGFAYFNQPGTERTDSTGQTLRYDLAQAGVAEGFDLGIRFHERIGIFARVGGTAVVGVNPESAVLEGAVFLFNWQAGASTMIWRFEESGTQIGARAGARGSVGSLVVPEPLVTSLIAATQEQEPADVNRLLGSNTAKLIFNDASSLGGGGSIAVAQAIGRHFSAQAAVGLAYESSEATFFNLAANREVGVAQGDFLLEPGLAITGDIHPYFPLAAQVEYQMRYRAPLSASVSDVGDVATPDAEAPSHQLGGGLYYSGRRALQLGLAAGAVINTFTRTERTEILGQFTMRFFF
jgi:hypothetical protein